MQLKTKSSLVEINKHLFELSKGILINYEANLGEMQHTDQRLKTLDK